MTRRKSREIAEPVKSNSDKPDGRVPKSYSFTSQLANLELGANAAKIKAVGYMPEGDFARFGPEMRNDLRNAVMSSARAAKKRAGHEFVTEVFNVISPAGFKYILAVVQRLK